MQSAGSTFLARLLGELGYDLGDNHYIENYHNEGQPYQIRGVQHVPLHNLLQKWERCADDVDLVDVLEVSKGLPEVVKNPFMARWLRVWLQKGGARPQHVLVTIRDVQEQSRSNAAAWKRPESALEAARSHLDLGVLLETLVVEDIPFTPILYPLSVLDPDYLIDSIWTFLDLPTPQMYYKAHKKIADPTLVHSYMVE